MVRTITTFVFTINELSGAARERALAELSAGMDINITDHAECILDDTRKAAELMGIDIDVSSESWSVDSASFVSYSFNGTYAFKKGAAAAVAKEFDEESPFVAIAKQLSALRIVNGVVIENGWCPDHDRASDLISDFRAEVSHMLQHAYEYELSEENLVEHANCNEYEFDEYGNIV